MKKYGKEDLPMRRIVALLLALGLFASTTLTVGATFTPSVSGKEAPEIPGTVRAGFDLSGQ